MNTTITGEVFQIGKLKVVGQGLKVIDIIITDYKGHEGKQRFLAVKGLGKSAEYFSKNLEKGISYEFQGEITSRSHKKDNGEVVFFTDFKSFRADELKTFPQTASEKIENENFDDLPF